MNWKNIFSTVLGGASNGAVQGLESQTGKISWAGVGIVAAFGAIAALAQALSAHPAVAAAGIAPQTPPAAAAQ